MKHHAASLHNQHSSMHIPAVSEDKRAGQREGFFLCLFMSVCARLRKRENMCAEIHGYKFGV